MEKLPKIIEEFVDFLMPELTPYEASYYIFLLRNSIIKNESSEIRIGKRTIAEKCGKGSRGQITAFSHVTEVLDGLERKGCIAIGDTNREGTLYTVFLPEQISLVVQKLRKPVIAEEEDYYNDPRKRLEIYEKDKWTCFYCGERVTSENATLDHFVPKGKGGTNAGDNLKTSCLVCNAIKSGKTYEEAALYLLNSIRERKVRSQ